MGGKRCETLQCRRHGGLQIGRLNVRRDSLNRSKSRTQHFRQFLLRQGDEACRRASIRGHYTRPYCLLLQLRWRGSDAIPRSSRSKQW